MSARRVPAWGCLIAAGVLAFVSFMVTILLAAAIWPGEAKLTAPLFCSNDKPDAFVVVDSYSVQPGETSYNFSLYCMGPRGETEEIGFMRPTLVLTLAHALLIVALVAGLVLLVRVRRRPPRAAAPLQDAV